MFARTRLGIRQHVVAGHDRAAARRFQDRAQDPERRGLPRTIGPEQAEDRPGPAFERDIRDRADPSALIVEERLAQTVNLDHTFGRPIGPPLRRSIGTHSDSRLHGFDATCPGRSIRVAARHCRLHLENCEGGILVDQATDPRQTNRESESKIRYRASSPRTSATPPA